MGRAKRKASVGRLCLESVTAGTDVMIAEGGSCKTQLRRCSISADSKYLVLERSNPREDRSKEASDKDDEAFSRMGCTPGVTMNVGMKIARAVLGPRREIALSKVRQILLSDATADDGEDRTPLPPVAAADGKQYIVLRYRKRGGDRDDEVAMHFDDYSLFSTWTLALSTLVYIRKHLRSLQDMRVHRWMPSGGVSSGASQGEGVQPTSGLSWARRWSSRVQPSDGAAGSARATKHELGRTGRHLVSDMLCSLVLESKVERHQWSHVVAFLSDLKWELKSSSSSRGMAKWLLQWARAEAEKRSPDDAGQLAGVMRSLASVKASSSQEINLFLTEECRRVCKGDKNGSKDDVPLFDHFERFISSNPASFVISLGQAETTEQCQAILHVVQKGCHHSHACDLSLSGEGGALFNERQVRALQDISAEACDLLVGKLVDKIDARDLARFTSSVEHFHNDRNEGAGEEHLSVFCVIAASLRRRLRGPTEARDDPIDLDDGPTLPTSQPPVVARRHSAPFSVSHDLFPIVEEKEMNDLASKERSLSAVIQANGPNGTSASSQQRKLFNRVSTRILDNIGTTSESSDIVDMEEVASSSCDSEEREGKTIISPLSPGGASSDMQDGLPDSKVSPSSSDYQQTPGECEGHAGDGTPSGSHEVVLETPLGADKGDAAVSFKEDYKRNFFSTFRALEKTAKYKRRLKKVKSAVSQSVIDLDRKIESLQSRVSSRFANEVHEGAKILQTQVTAKSPFPDEDNDMLKSALWRTVIQLSLELQSEKRSHQQLRRSIIEQSQTFGL